MKVAFVIPWYGNIPGGAESECRTTAEHLAARGVEVEILTTCVKEFLSDWNTNHYPEGIYHEGGLMVRRFPVRKRNTRKFDRINYKLIHAMAISPEEESIFIREMINSTALCKYIQDHGNEYDYFFFIPYMFGTTYFGAQIHPAKSILIPCLHDESYAYLEIYKPLFRSVRTILYNTGPEKDLCNRIMAPEGNQVVMGIGVDTTIGYDARRFADTFGITDPFILYAGRRDPGKMVDELIRYFTRYLEETGSALKLVLIGKGEITIPRGYSDRVIDLGFLPVQDKYDAYAAASVFCMPSLNESFSLVMMESWLCGAPNLVNGGCEVTKSHCIRSNGGLYYGDYEEFEACLSYLMTHPDIRVRMGENGRRYVQKEYDWDIIMNRYLSLLGAN
jgi:glycosyltransferase involved in cell wall biosynthesis